MIQAGLQARQDLAYRAREVLTLGPFGYCQSISHCPLEQMLACGTIGTEQRIMDSRGSKQQTDCQKQSEQLGLSSWRHLGFLFFDRRLIVAHSAFYPQYRSSSLESM